MATKLFGNTWEFLGDHPILTVIAAERAQEIYDDSRLALAVVDLAAMQVDNLGIGPKSYKDYDKKPVHLRHDKVVLINKTGTALQCFVVNGSHCQHSYRISVSQKVIDELGLSTGEEVQIAALQ